MDNLGKGCRLEGENGGTRMAQEKGRKGSRGLVPMADLFGDMLDQFPRIALAPRRGPGADVDEIPGFDVALSEDVALRVVQEWQEFVEEAFLAFGGEFVV